MKSAATLEVGHPVGHPDPGRLGSCTAYPGGAIGYPRNGGTYRKLPSPRRARLCSRRIPNPQDTRRDAPGKRSAPLRCRLAPRWMGARGVR